VEIGRTGLENDDDEDGNDERNKVGFVCKEVYDDDDEHEG
jgi:hypothetical protein